MRLILSHALIRQRVNLSITVIGAPLDDIGLMRTSSAFATGRSIPTNSNIWSMRWRLIVFLLALRSLYSLTRYSP